MATTITITPSQLTTVSGSPTLGTDFDGAPVLRLPNASNEFAFIADTAEVGQKYDVYMLWSMSAAPTSPSPAFVVLAGTYQAWSANSSPSGTTKFFGLVPPQATGIIERSQLPFSFTREDSGRIARLRYGRRSDSNVGGQVQIRGFELVPTPSIVEASITQGATLTPASFNTPYATTKVISLLSLYTPIWSTANFVYVVAPVTIGGVQQSRLAKLNKSTYEVVQDVQLTNVGTHDSVIGHRDGSVCVTDDGKVIAYGEAHHSAWKGVASPTEDISALALTSAPVGVDQQCSYRRFFRNPFDGSMWMGVRGNGYVAGVYKWNGSTFDRKPTGSLIAGDPGGFQGSYGMEIVFTDVNTLYVSTEFRQGTDGGTMSGYPRQNISVIKSTDGGATFTTMRGKALNLPIIAGSDDSDIAFPNNSLDHNSAVGRLAVGADNQPILVASWKHPEEPRRSLWVAKYNTATNKWMRTRLLPHTSTVDAGTPHIAHHNGKVYVTAATTDDNLVAGNNNQLYLFISSDSGATWKQYAISHPTGAYSGAYIDPAALRLDNKLRMLPDYEAQPNSVVWEMAIPADAGTADTTAPVMTGVITVSAVTSSGFTLSVDAATDAVGVTGYEYSIDGGTNYTVIPNAARTVTVTGRPASTSHPVRMRAFDAAGNKATPLSATATTTAAADTTAPVMVAPITVSAQTATGFTLAWPAATDNVGVASYEVDNGSGSYVNVGTVRTLTVTGKMASTAYNVRVRALDAAGNAATPLTATATTTGDNSTAPPTFVRSTSRTIIIGEVPGNFDQDGKFWLLTNPKRPTGSIDPNSTIDITFDWTKVLADIDAGIADIQFDILGLTGKGAYGEGAFATIFVSNATGAASITCRITTDSVPPRIEDRTVFLNVEQH